MKRCCFILLALFPFFVFAKTLTPSRFVTHGEASRIIINNLYTCPMTNAPNTRLSAVGEIKAEDGTWLTVPGKTAFQAGFSPKSTDFYNQCQGITPENTAAVSTKNVPIITIDPDGEVITGFIVADNYYELWINGKLVSIDSIPYTPFNSAVVKFRVKYPYTIAVLLVDWEEHLGVGTEAFDGDDWHAGDGGFIAKFSDGTVTDKTWKAQSFYISPVKNPNDVIERGTLHDTHLLGTTYPLFKKPSCEAQCFGVHYPMQKNWQEPTFKDTFWPYAAEFTDTDVGTLHLPEYTRFPELFQGAHWIWSQNLVLDNLVIVRKTVTKQS